MNKPMFWSGLTMVGAELLAVLAFAIGFYLEITKEILMYSIAGLALVGFTITGMIFMIVGAIKK